MDEPTEDFTVIACAWQRSPQEDVQYSYFVRINGRWLGVEDLDDSPYAEVTAGYHSVTVVARPVGAD